MMPKQHIIINLIISLILFLFIEPVYSMIIFLSSVLIDADHYLYYVIEKKKFSLKKAYNWHLIRLKKYRQLSDKEKDRHKNFLFVFHGIEPLVIVYLLSLYFPVLFYVFLGFAMHLTEDLFVAHKDRITKMKLFLIYQIYRHFKLKRLGIKDVLNV